MSLLISPTDWLAVLRSEYLEGFVKKGGAAVKFAVSQERLAHQGLVEAVGEASREAGYLFVPLDAATTKVHMIDKIFNAIAKQVDWRDLAGTFLRSNLSGSHYLLPAGRDDFTLERLAELNGLDPAEMQRNVNKVLRGRLFRDYAMTQEFRIAMMRLCEAQIEPRNAGPGLAEAVEEWLRGELKLIAALKSALIFQRVGRHNGRHMIASLTHWLHVAGKAGLVLSLDISRLLESRRMPDGSFYYSGAAVLDGYEVLRQFVDSTDELHFCLILVLAPSAFLDEYERRGLRSYDALRLRIWDEVRDRQRPNPLSSLIRLSAGNGSPVLPDPGGAI